MNASADVLLRVVPPVFRLSLIHIFRCHRSYIVGLAYAARINKKELLLDDGTSVPVSRRLFQEVNRAFVAYYRREESGEYGTGERT